MYAFPVQPALRCNDKDANATLYASMMCSVFHDPLERKVYQRRATERHRHVNRHLSAEFTKQRKERKRMQDGESQAQSRKPNHVGKEKSIVE
jgi:hypothetical protein